MKQLLTGGNVMFSNRTKDLKTISELNDLRKEKYRELSLACENLADSYDKDDKQSVDYYGREIKQIFSDFLSFNRGC